MAILASKTFPNFLHLPMSAISIEYHIVFGRVKPSSSSLIYCYIHLFSLDICHPVSYPIQFFWKNKIIEFINAFYIQIHSNIRLYSKSLYLQIKFRLNYNLLYCSCVPANNTFFCSSNLFPFYNK